MYKITIEETKQVRKNIGKKWEPLRRVGDKTDYGYTEEVESLETVTTNMYMQVVEELDLVGVIDAINRPSRPVLSQAR